MHGSCACVSSPAALLPYWLIGSSTSDCVNLKSLFSCLLCLPLLHSQKYRLQLWKVQFATGVTLSFQRDLSLTPRGGSQLRHERWKRTNLFCWGVHPFKCHPIGPCLSKVVQFCLSYLLCVLECACVCSCACSGVCVVSQQPRMMGRSGPLLPPSGPLPWWSHLRVNKSFQSFFCCCCWRGLFIAGFCP